MSQEIVSVPGIASVPGTTNVPGTARAKIRPFKAKMGHFGLKKMCGDSRTLF